MENGLSIKRTHGSDPDFQLLISHLDRELWDELKEDQATYDQYNKVPDIKTAIVVYHNSIPVASGCFKKFTDDTAEIKRMFVEKECRGKGISKTVLNELEKWAGESGFTNAVLETSVHFKIAKSLYENAGYKIIPNYGQYKDLPDSVCMKKELIGPSEFKGLKGIEYFNFEEDFVEENIRCIPMIVRFKMDAAGIKLKLSEWSKFNVEERIELALKNCNSDEEAKQYNDYLAGLIKKYTGKEATVLSVNQNPEWTDVAKVPELLQEKIKKFDYSIRKDQWKGLSNLQRFALIKLSREGHESKNLPKALKEFALI
jgi:hypothetical protein